MKVRPRHDRSAGRKPSQGGGLQRKLLWSHLTVAAVGLAMLCVALASNLWLRSHTIHLATVRGPVVESAKAAQNGIQRSLAALRGWVMLGDEKFKAERRAAWDREIRPALAALKRLSAHLSDGQTDRVLSELTRLVEDLDDSQWWVEDAAQMPGNEPARVVLSANVAPISDRIVQAVQRMIQIEKVQPSSPQRKQLLAQMADFLGAFALGRLMLNEFVERRGADGAVFVDQWKQTNQRLKELNDRIDMLSDEQTDLFRVVHREMRAFRKHAQEAVKTRKSAQWNVAQHLTATETVPIGRRLTMLLDGLSAAQARHLRADAHRVTELSNLAIGILLGLILLMSVVAWAVSSRNARRISRPVQSLVVATELLARGDLDNDLLVRSDDELGKLTNSFNLMRASLERRTAELESARQVAESANRTKSEFLASMSHELRTPLNAIIGFTDGLLNRADRHPLSPYQTSRLARVKVAGHHLLTLINDVLDIAKVESGEMRANVGTFSAADLAREVAELIEPLIAEKENVTFGLHVEDGIPPIESDGEKVKQILVNLLSNAVKFVDGGSVRLVVLREGEHVQFSVEDTGIGIPPEEIHKVFDKFHQVPDDRLRGGTGLGLALCQRFTDLLGGVLGVRSIKGAGSTFTLSIPLKLDGSLRSQEEALVEQVHARHRDAPVSPQQKTVLCIEDNPHNMLLLQDALSEGGYHVIPALNGDDGLRAGREQRPAAVVLDIMLPGLHGWEVLRRLKSDREDGSQPVIVLTALDQKDLGMSLGADEFLTKPIDVPQLLASLARVTKGRGDRQRPSVALADDDRDARDLLGETLADAGYEVHTYNDGKELLEGLGEIVPDAFVLDLMMPGMDGFEVIDALRGDARWHSVPILVLTAKILSSSEMKRLNEHVRLVIKKNGMASDHALSHVVAELDRLFEGAIAA